MNLLSAVWFPNFFRAGTKVGVRFYVLDADEIELEFTMPAKSKAQQRAAGAALSAKRKETKVSDLQGASKEMYDSMTEEELEEIASTDHDGLPETVDED